MAAEANRPSLRPCYRKSVQLLRDVSDAARLEKDVCRLEDLGLHLYRPHRLTRIRSRRYGAGTTFLGISNNLASGRACPTHVYLGRDTRSGPTGWTGYQGFTVADCDRVTNSGAAPREFYLPSAVGRRRRGGVPLQRLERSGPRRPWLTLGVESVRPPGQGVERFELHRGEPANPTSGQSPSTSPRHQYPPTSRPARHDARRSAAARPGPLPSPLARPRSGVRPGRTCSAGARRT